MESWFQYGKVFRSAVSANDSLTFDPVPKYTLRDVRIF